MRHPAGLRLAAECGAQVRGPIFPRQMRTILRPGQGLPDEATIRRHRDQEAAFCRQANAHGRIARHHDAVMECMRALEAAAAAAM